jgi:hypothetical protein
MVVVDMSSPRTSYSSSYFFLLLPLVGVFDNCVGVLVICVLVFTVFCIVGTVLCTFILIYSVRTTVTE